MTEKWLHDTGMACVYDGEPIEYTDPVVMLSVVRPTLTAGTLNLVPLTTEDEGDFLYQPLFFHSTNWDRAEEGLQPYLESVTALPCEQPLLTCAICSSGIAAEETSGLLTFGMFERSRRNPNGDGFGRRFEADNKDHAVVCIACLRLLNDEVHTLWEDGVCHEDECADGTQTRCWRSGCPGSCEEAEDEEDEEE